MITFSPEFEAIMKAPVKTVRAKFYVHDNSEGTDTPIFEGDESSISITTIGQFNNSGASKLTAKIVGNHASALNAFLKVDLDAKSVDDFESITLGFYTVFTVEYDIDTNMSTLELYDQMAMFGNEPYSIGSETYPMTVDALAGVIAGLGGLELDPNFVNLPNAYHTIPVDLWATIQNITYRDVINSIAQTTGTTAVVSGKKLLFKVFDGSLYTVSEQNLVKFKLGQKFGNINSVVLGRSPQNDNVLLRDQEDAEVNGIFEVAVTNNQIMDNYRETMILPLYNYFVSDTPYLSYYGAELTTEGHGWYEIGDVITANLDGVGYRLLITEINLTIDGGIQEVIKSVIPTDPSVNKTTAGGIIKTLWNTEIKVDKQENDITSIVSRQDQFENATNDNFTEIYQNIDEIQVSVQDGGGVNQIKNSVGYSLDENGDLQNWEVTDVTVSASVDTNSLIAGAQSGNRIDLSDGAGFIKQTVITKPGAMQNLTFYAEKGTQGVAKVILQNDADYFEVTLEDDQNYDWTRFVINDFVPTTTYIDVIIQIDGDVETFSITDLMMAKGAVPIAWQQAVGEVMNTNVTFDEFGITVKSNVQETSTKITPNEFSGYYKDEKVFTLNSGVTRVSALKIGDVNESTNIKDGDIETPTHMIVFLDSGPNAGMNFVVKG